MGPPADAFPGTVGDTVHSLPVALLQISAKPALLIKLKWNKSAQGAISQIKEKK